MPNLRLQNATLAVLHLVHTGYFPPKASASFAYGEKHGYIARYNLDKRLQPLTGSNVKEIAQEISTLNIQQKPAEIVDASRSLSGGVKERSRVVEHGEVFTPQWVVDNMLNLLPDKGERDVWATPDDGEQKRFLEPACGEGAFLVNILARKLQRIDLKFSANQDDWEWHSAIAVSSIYGIELLEDNSERCIQNLYETYLDFYYEHFRKSKNPNALSAIKFLISRNIMQGDALKFLQRDGNPIIVSEFKPLKTETGDRLFVRKDFEFSKLAKGKDAPIDLLSLNGERGLMAIYAPINWQEIEFAEIEKRI